MVTKMVRTSQMMMMVKRRMMMLMMMVGIGVSAKIIIIDWCQYYCPNHCYRYPQTDREVQTILTVN